MDTNKNYFKKAKERYEIAEIAYNKSYYDVCSSNLYYTLFICVLF